MALEMLSSAEPTVLHWLTTLDTSRKASLWDFCPLPPLLLSLGVSTQSPLELHLVIHNVA